MNIHTYFVMKLKEKTDLKKHHASILKKLDGVNTQELAQLVNFIEKRTF